MTTRILVVDDSALSLKITYDTLSQAGYEIVSARNGLEALMQVDQVQAQLIILDVMMPEMDGYEVCRRLRHKAGTAHLPIMMLTAQDTLEEKIMGFEAGADDYMIKPFQPTELLAHVKVLLRRAAPLQIESPAKEQAKAQAPALQGKTIAVFSLRGGVGVSSLAANMASGLAQVWDEPTVLVDLALTAGHSALMLNLAPRRTWADLTQIPIEEIDADLIASVLLPHSSKTLVLAAPRRPEHSELLTADKVSRVLKLLNERYHYIVLDLPHDFSAITLAGLDAAHEIIVPLAPELASVLAVSSALDVFDNLGYPPERIRLALNQTIQNNGLTTQVIEDAIRRPLKLTIPFAPDAFVQAINLGVPPVLGAAHAPLVALLEDWVFQLSKDEHRNKRPDAPSKSWKRIVQRLQQRQKKATR
ncbi:MAG: response regulator [Thermoflexales bacterium]|nr:response regulator [Thermoflexales bacterium]